MFRRSTIRCANPRCGTECGVEYPSTHSDPGYADLDGRTVIDDVNGDVFCSQDCYNASHPVYCVDCHDEAVGKAGDRCTYCAIAAEQGEDAAYEWYRSQHPELFRKPVASVPAAAALSVVRKNAV